mmetsp:Transcript_21424/g.49867  ORF Transcript_21424/g.49867 Transcript_21424/m.49867 type:complete len:424 (+) Transcript_21424:239-1510(+)|eukprot:CAMPEP_0178440724 /NCGR_PEP_ID=MMETSP0689_2-20121128/36960_1 /TAXON_ID=160604 /ORGANISM="Amphidinium massartii, Strain CS-259" /LENGTH=423 /DNA_ID=CAMNT_0020063575 /DNA_START=137 /DNA_END=1408 /DNA_ORIENTATION=+
MLTSESGPSITNTNLTVSSKTSGSMVWGQKTAVSATACPGHCSKAKEAASTAAKSSKASGVAAARASGMPKGENSMPKRHAQKLTGVLEQMQALLRQCPPETRRNVILSMSEPLRRQLTCHMERCRANSASTAKVASVSCGHKAGARNCPLRCSRGGKLGEGSGIKRPFDMVVQEEHCEQDRVDVFHARSPCQGAKESEDEPQNEPNVYLRRRGQRRDFFIVSVSIENLHIMSTQAACASEASMHRHALQQLKCCMEQLRAERPEASFEERFRAAEAVAPLPPGLQQRYFTRFRATQMLGGPRQLSTPTTTCVDEALDHHSRMHWARSAGSDILLEVWKKVVEEQRQISASDAQEHLEHAGRTGRIRAPPGPDSKTQGREKHSDLDGGLAKAVERGEVLLKQQQQQQRGEKHWKCHSCKNASK